MQRERDEAHPFRSRDALTREQASMDHEQSTQSPDLLLTRHEREAPESCAPEDSWTAGPLLPEDSGIDELEYIERPGAALRAHRSDLHLLVVSLIAGIGMATVVVFRAPPRPKAVGFALASARRG